MAIWNMKIKEYKLRTWRQTKTFNQGKAKASSFMKPLSPKLKQWTAGE